MMVTPKTIIHKQEDAHEYLSTTHNFASEAGVLPSTKNAAELPIASLALSLSLLTSPYSHNLTVTPHLQPIHLSQVTTHHSSLQDAINDSFPTPACSPSQSRSRQCPHSLQQLHVPALLRRCRSRLCSALLTLARKPDPRNSNECWRSRPQDHQEPACLQAPVPDRDQPRAKDIVV